MATYKEIKGVTVQTKDEDPVVNVGSWSSGGDLNNIRYGAFGFGIQTASIAATGSSPPFSPSLTPVVEQYNGTSWTEIADVNQTRNLGGAAGTVTEGLIFGGTPGSHNETEDWNGSAWTEVNNLNTGRQQISGNGTGTAAIAAAGYTTANVNNVETWDGTNWTETTENNTARRGLFGVGPYTSTIVFGGKVTDTSALAETWNGSAWTEVSDLNQARTLVGGSGGSSTDGLAFGGATGPTSGSYANTENWNGTVWTEVADLATARQAGASSGTSTSALYASGTTDGGSTIPAQSEEWSFPPPTAAILTEGDLFLSGGTTLKGFGKAAGIPAGTWASGGSLNTARTIGGGFGLTIPTAVCAGGYNPGGWKALTEEYNGSAFTEVNDMPQATDDMGSGGSLTAGIIFGGDTPPGNTPTNIALGYDGTNWTTLSSLNTARRSIGGAGVQTSALAFGGQEPGSASAKTESWDGSSWTETSDLNTARMGVQGAGHSNTAAIGAGGGLSPVINNVEQWDGSSWTEKNNLNTARSFFAAGGVSTDALFYGGYVGTPSYTGKTESWDGTSMTELNDLSTGRGSSGALPAGGAISQIATGGNPQPTASSETFEAEATLSTVTVS